MKPNALAGIELHVRGGWPRRLVIAVTALAAVGLVGACLVPLVPVWPCMLLEHFRVQYAVVGGMVARSGLCDSRAGFGIAASFPAASALVRIPIDHVLASCAIGVRDRRIERDVGSDHLPVVIELVVPRPRA